MVSLLAGLAGIVKVQAPVPEQPPLQPANVAPEAAAAVSVTELPALKRPEQGGAQSMPEGEDVTVPLPMPCLLTCTMTVRASVTVKSTGAPAAKVTFEALPE